MESIHIPETWCGVYHIIRDNEVIYVGQTANIFSRIATWRSRKFKHEHFDRVEFFPCDLDELSALEEEHIARLKPPLNVEGVTKPYRERPWIRVADAPRWWYERRAMAMARKRRDAEQAT